jgi:subtilase family serine protease
MVADPFTGVEIIQTISGQTSVAAFGGTSLATPMFSGVMAVAAQKAGHGLGQAAPLLYDLPAGAVVDIGNADKSGNITGINTTPSGTVNLSSDDLTAPLFGVSDYMSAMYNSPFSTRWFVLTFGTDTSLSTGVGYDNITGVGTPNGAEFVNAIVP